MLYLNEANYRADVLSSGHSGTQTRDPERRLHDSGIDSDHTPIDMDPPRHTRYRQLVNRGFTPGMISLGHTVRVRVAGETRTAAVALSARAAGPADHRV